MSTAENPHRFAPKFFTLPTWCKYCGRYIWQAPGRPGYLCTNQGCSYSVHKRCGEQASLLFECAAASAQPEGRQEESAGPVAFEHQVAGHKGRASMLKDGHTILKPLNDHEFEFYELINRYPSVAPAKFFPKYYGCRSRETDTGVKKYIVLEDLTAGLRGPCICDLKIGTRGHDDKATTHKYLQQKALCKLTTSSTMGFRMCGMRVWQLDGPEIIRDKRWGSKLKETTMRGALVQFLDNGEGVRFDIIPRWLAKLYEIKQWFEEQTMFNFYSSSILLIYDGASLPGGTSDGDSDDKEEHVDVRMVDFAHVDAKFDARGIKTKSASSLSSSSSTTKTRSGADATIDIDENYLKGLNNVIVLLESMLSDFASEESSPRTNHVPLVPSPGSPTSSPRETKSFSLRFFRGKPKAQSSPPSCASPSARDIGDENTTHDISLRREESKEKLDKFFLTREKNLERFLWRNHLPSGSPGVSINQSMPNFRKEHLEQAEKRRSPFDTEVKKHRRRNTHTQAADGKASASEAIPSLSLTDSKGFSVVLPPSSASSSATSTRSSLRPKSKEKVVVGRRGGHKRSKSEGGATFDRAALSTITRGSSENEKDKARVTEKEVATATTVRSRTISLQKIAVTSDFEEDEAKSEERSLSLRDQLSNETTTISSCSSISTDEEDEEDTSTSEVSPHLLLETEKSDSKKEESKSQRKQKKKKKKTKIKTGKLKALQRRVYLLERQFVETRRECENMRRELEELRRWKASLSQK
ncbi:Inositol hexakisphosphate kinase 1 [Balamuthia mandrillaris]